MTQLSRESKGNGHTNEKKEVMYCYYMARIYQPRGYHKRMYNLYQQRGNFECTEQWLCGQKKQIEDKMLLTPVEIEEVKNQLKKDNTPDNPIQSAIPKPENQMSPEVPEPENPPNVPTTPEEPEDDEKFAQLK